MSVVVEKNICGKRWVDINERWVDIHITWLDFISYYMYNMYATDFIEINEKQSNLVGKVKEESIEISEKQSKFVNKHVTEITEINEVIEKFYELNVTEMVDMIEKFLRIIEYKRTFEYTLEVEEVVEKFYELNKKEMLDVIEKFIRVVEYKRLFTEKIDVKEAVVKLYGLNKKEFLDVLEVYLRNADTIISDLRLYGKAFNETDFDSLLTPIGYERFKEMVTGDYLYEKALCRIVLEATANSDRPNLREYIHNVDVPDTYDSGFATFTTTNQPVYTLFTRPFKVVPDLRLTLKSADTTIDLNWMAISVTREGFTAQFKSGTAYTGGKLSFSARGY